MPESRRADAKTDGGAADCEHRAEVLLVEGLDHDLAGRYDDAIHLWTRVLFLDRSHARARAYIDRARTALAERQRRSEELLHAGQALLEQGQTEQARSMLTEAVATSGDDERAADLRARLERLERVHATRSGAPSADYADARHLFPDAPRFRGALLIAAAVVVMLGAASTSVVQEWLGTRFDGEHLTNPLQSAPLPVLSSSDVALVRAQTLFARGRLAEALQALDRVEPSSATRNAADGLRVEIQQLLLASGRESLTVTRSSEAGRR